MPPEYMSAGSSAEVGITSDIYALGGVLYSLLALDTPLSSETPEGKMILTQKGEVPPPSAVAPEWVTVPASLEAVCRKAMALNPRDRYSSVSELRSEISAFMSGYAPMAENASFLRRTMLFLWRNRVALLVALLATATVLLLSLYLQYKGQ
jgi:serine/threonine protein kinase